MTHPEQTRGSEVSRLLFAWSRGDADAYDRLMPLVYEELRRLARSQLARDDGCRTLQPTALVHEAYLRLLDAEVAWESRGHFLAIASKVMRRILVEEARRRQADKRGQGDRPVSLDGVDVAAAPAQETRFLALDQALHRLAQQDPRRAKVIELRHFAGLTITETAAVLGLSHATVERDLRFAQAWLARHLQPQPAPAAASGG